MRSLRGILVVGSVGLLTSLATVVGGCVSDDNTGPGELDSGFSLSEDSSPPPGSDSAAPDSTVATPDAGSDTAQPPLDSGVVDSTVTDSGQDSAPIADSALPDSNDSSFDAADAADSAVPQAFVRLAWLTDDFPGIDLCVAPHGTGLWQGPLLAGAGLTTGVPSYGVTKYFSVPAGQDDVRVLPPGSTSCSLPDGGGSLLDITNLPTIPPGTSATVAAEDSEGPTPTIAAFVDETVFVSGQVKLRFINGAESTAPATFSLGSGVAVSPLFSNVTPTPGIDPTADTLGYRTMSPLNGIDTSLQANGINQVVTADEVFPVDGVMTVFAVGSPPTEDAGTGYQYGLLFCFDGQLTVAVPALTSCTLTTTSVAPSYTRFANFLADTSAPTVDVCIKYHDLATFAGPLLNGPVVEDSGVPIVGLAPLTQSFGTPAALSGYFNVQGGHAYDVRLVVAGSPDCSTGVVTGLYNAPIGAGGVAENATLAATGFLTPPGDAGEPTMFDAGLGDSGPANPGLSSVAFAYATFVDENFLGSGDLARVLHVAALNPQPFDLTSSLWSFTDVQYGAFGSLPPTVDANGYRSVPLTSREFILSQTIGGAEENEEFIQINGTEAATFFIYSYFDGEENDMEVMECTDSAITFGGLWSSCQILNGG